MRRVYVSSTYTDQRAERRAAIDAIARLKQANPVAMETYTSGAGTPLEVCLQDVRRCDVYVGIVSWRYGYIPPGQSKSITELEYEAAGERKIPCLCFLRDGQEPWWGSWSSDRRRARAFRARLGK